MPKPVHFRHRRLTIARKPIHVSLLAISDALTSTLSGLYEVLTCFEWISKYDDAVPALAPFDVEIVVPGDPDAEAGALSLGTHRTFDEVAETDIVIVPAMRVENEVWRMGRHAEAVDWLEAMHRRGAILCSACSGVLLLAETGLLDGREATIHWAYARTFRQNFPAVDLRLDKVLIATGGRGQFLMSGASASWHDLVLYLVARHVGPTAALAVAKFLLLQWHADGQAPYVLFEASTDHGDARVLQAQQWLRDHFAVAAPVDELIARSGLSERSFGRRFKKATGYTAIAYVQHLRVEEAKKRLERTDTPVDDISWAVGYEDPAFFRRLFKRITRITPGAYRRKFRLPDYAA